MARVCPSISVITLSVNGLNLPIKDRLAKWIKNNIQLFSVYKRLTLELRTKCAYKLL